MAQLQQCEDAVAKYLTPGVTDAFWYCKSANHSDAEKLLKGQPDGALIIRFSSKPEMIGSFVLSYKQRENVYNQYATSTTRGLFCKGYDQTYFKHLMDLVDYYLSHEDAAVRAFNCRLRVAEFKFSPQFSELKAELLPNGQLPKEIQVWTTRSVMEVDSCDREQKVEDAKATMPWLIKAVKNAHLDPKIKDGVKQLLLTANFTQNLEYLKCWNSFNTGVCLHTEVRGILGTLGQQLLCRYNQLNLATKLSDQVISNQTFDLHATLQNKNYPKRPLSSADILPEIPGFFNYDQVENCDERVFLIIIQMIALVVNGLFQNKLRLLMQTLGIPVDDLKSATIKQYTRALNKAQSDYLGLPPPRTGYNVDVMRTLLMLPDVDAIVSTFHTLGEEFGGIARLKNFYAYPEDQRKERHHLCTIMLIVVMDSGLTFGKMTKNPKNQKLWNDFVMKVPHTEPIERWGRMCSKGMEFLNHAAIADQRVCVLGEIQMILKDDAPVRTKMHLAYKISRAENVLQLYADFLDSYGERPKWIDLEADNPYVAAALGRLTDVKKSLAQGWPIDLSATDEGNNPLFIAASSNHPDVVKYLLDENAFVDHATTVGDTALYTAASKNYLDIVRLLVAQNASIDQANNDTLTPLGIASQNNHMEVVKFLLSNNASINNPNNKGNNPLYCASGSGHLEMAQFLHSNGAAIDQPTQTGSTALWNASQKNGLEVVKFLHSKGASVHTATLMGFTPLTIACTNDGAFEAAEFLISKNAEIDAADEDGTTPLMYSVIGGHTDIVKLLLANNASINKVEKNGRSALNCAACDGRLEIVKLLCETSPGADVNVQANYPWGTPLYEAIGHDQHEVAAYLRSRGGQEGSQPSVIRRVYRGEDLVQQTTYCLP